MGFEWGAFAFGLVIGWFTYFVNRYRSEVVLGDVATIIGAVGGGAVLALFPQGVCPEREGELDVGERSGAMLLGR